MAIHDDLVAPVAIHPAAFFGVTDPALDPTNNVLAYKLWVDTTSGPPYALKIRNATNTAWEAVSGGGSGSSTVMGPPGFAEDGEPGEIGVPGLAGAPGVAGSIAEDGWIAAGETWTFAAADAPTFTFTVPTNLTAKYTPGTRIKLTHAATVKYFIVTASVFGASTTVTVYGGTDYTLAAGAITLPFFSRMKGPAGFPLSPDKWTVVTTDTTLATQAAPVAGTWYNLGSIQVSIPIGAWYVDYQTNQYTARTGAATGIGQTATLSTGSSSETDTEFTSFSQTTQASTASVDWAVFASRSKQLVLSSKTSYFLNAKTVFSSITSINHYGSIAATKIRALCAYL